MKFGILLIVTALIVILVLFMGKGRQANPVQQGMAALDKTKAVTVEMDMNSISAAITTYFGDTGDYPENLDMLVPKYLPSTNSITDSWGVPFQLEKDDQQNFTLVSAGPDRVLATADDIRRSL